MCFYANGWVHSDPSNRVLGRCVNGKAGFRDLLKMSQSILQDDKLTSPNWDHDDNSHRAHRLYT